MIAKIGSRTVGPGAPAFLIAEVGQNHDGSLGTAHAFIDAAADTGVDAVKFQTHLADAESTRDEPFRVRFSEQDPSRYDYWKRMEFTADQWQALATHARERGLVFLSSAFSVPAVELLADVGVPAWKVGSGEYASFDLLEAMVEAGGPIILSTGMSRWREIDEAVEFLRDRDAELCLLQCTSSYPSTFETVGLNVLDDLRRRYGCPVGLSDHTGSIWPALFAIGRGADLVEAHITLSRRMFGPDVSASLTIEDFKQLASGRDALRVMDTNPVDKDSMAEHLASMRDLFSKSLAPSRALAKGTRLDPGMLSMKKPGTGIPPERIDEVVGSTLRRRVQPDRLLRWEDLDLET